MATFSSAIHLKPPPRIHSPHSSVIIYSYISITNMTDKAQCASPPSTPTQPPWMLTPPRSAEKLLRALSIDPCGSNGTVAIPHNDKVDSPYMAYLRKISSAAYRDPPLPSGSPPKPEPLFIEDEEEDDIQIGTDNRMVSCLLTALIRRCSFNPRTIRLPIRPSPSVLTRMTKSNLPVPSSLPMVLHTSVSPSSEGEE